MSDRKLERIWNNQELKMLADDVTFFRDSGFSGERWTTLNNIKYFIHNADIYYEATSTVERNESLETSFFAMSAFRARIQDDIEKLKMLKSNYFSFLFSFYEIKKLREEIEFISKTHNFLFRLSLILE